MPMQYKTAADAIGKIKSGDRVFIQGSAATPSVLVRALMENKANLRDIELISITTIGDGLFDVPGFGKHFFMNSMFVSANVRNLVNTGQGGYIPVFLSEIHELFENSLVLPDVALIQVSPPDKHGYCSMGTSIDITRSAVSHSPWTIAQVNPRMPRTHGDGQIHVSEIDSFVWCDTALPEVDYAAGANNESRKIGEYCAGLIEDRSTLQVGIGAIPDAVLSCLAGHKDLGIHSEMFSDGVVPLVEKNIITNRYKKHNKGKIVTSFALGTKRLYDFLDDNPAVSFLDISYVNNPGIIGSHPRMVAINSAIEIDLTGQVCADSIGTYQYSGVGGQMDFMRGAAISERGKPIIAMASSTRDGKSKIVPFLQPGAGVVTTRAHLHYVVTEYGVANLFGKNLKQRAVALRDIAHPRHRDFLDAEIFSRFR
ncbi:MAG: acetyl-CoA hydrolase/transferase family protein [Chitinophagaceae bacterium]|nr:MAG: acetyl-CoA hydrolase/transferase family protein [Chitinophagaceae bacterium]